MSEPPSGTAVSPAVGRTVRAGVVAIVALAVLAALVRFPAQLRDLGETASANGALSYADRDVAGGNSVLPEQRAAYELRGRIPEGAAYTTRVGERQAGWTDLTSASIEPFLRYWLLPRRPAADAEWIVCIGCDVAELGGGVREEWSGEGGVRLLRRNG